jgi:hypothetical protein
MPDIVFDFSICGVEFQYHRTASLNNSSSNLVTFITGHSKMTTFIISARTGSQVMWVGWAKWRWIDTNE